MKPVPGFPDYFASIDGSVYSLKKRAFGDVVPGVPRPLPKRVDNRGYNCVWLYRDGKVRKINVARVILLTFVGEPSGGMFACHGPNGRLDDSLENVYWGTPTRNNGQDKRRDGTAIVGERNHKHKLTELQARIVLRCLSFGVAYVPLSKIFAVSRNAIRLIAIGKNWSHLRGTNA